MRMIPGRESLQPSEHIGDIEARYTFCVMAETQGLEQDAFRLVRKHSLQVAESLPRNEVAQALGEFEAHERVAETQHPIRDWQRWLEFDEPDS